MDLLENWGIGCYFYPEAIRRELKYDSPTARELLDRVRAPLPKGCAPRNYEFYASTDDLAVPDLDSSLPRLDKGESTVVVHGENHDSIISAVAEKQIRSCHDWMKITLLGESEYRIRNLRVLS